MRNATRSARQWRNRLAISFFFCVGLVPAVGAQQPMAQLPATTMVPPGQQASWTLADCVHIGFEGQPTLAAQRASVAAAQAQCVALDRMVCFSLLSREMGFRKQQASLGVIIAQAGVEIAEWETQYAVTRCYYSMVYARRQEIVAKGLLEKLEMAQNNAQAIVKKGDPDLVVTQVDVDKLAVTIDLLQLRLIEASTGVTRAWAALREAMGVRYDMPLPMALEDLPPLGEVPPAETLVQMALTRRGEIVQAGCAANLAELEICAQNTGCLLPFKNTFAAAADVHARPIPQGSNDVNYRPGAVGLEMPTTLVGRKADRVARARELSNRAGAVVEKTQGLIALETEDAFGKWQAAASQVKILRASAPKSAKLAEVISGRFDNGKVSGEDYLRARTLEEQTQSQLNEALFQQALALAALERVTAGGYTPNFRRP